jgi:hypothetical protein
MELFGCTESSDLPLGATPVPPSAPDESRAKTASTIDSKTAKEVVGDHLVMRSRA